MNYTLDQIEGTLNWASSRLTEEYDIAEARLDAELLLSFCLDRTRTWLKTWPDYQLSQSEKKTYNDFIERRLSGEPVAYIIGYQEFWSLTLKVTSDTLIPRPETELLVEWALQKIPQTESFSVADLGTGTGAIALAIASERPHTQVFAVDFSEKALAVAEINRDMYQLDSVKLIHNSWLNNWSEGKLDLIVANPPYVAEGDSHLDKLTFEPLSALVAEKDGYSDILDIATQAKLYLKPGAFLMFEHGFEQAKEVRNILNELGYSAIQSVQDLSGQDRVTMGKFIA